MIVRFLLVCEGSSDGALVHHIRALLIKHGATEADGSPYHSGTPLSEKVKQGLELSGSPDLLFIHRDADNHHNTAAAGPKKRDAVADLAMLRKLRVVADDEDGSPWATVGGILLCTREPEQWLPHARIQAVCYAGTRRDINYQLDARDCGGPLDQQVIEALHFARRNMRVAASKGLARLDRPQFSERALFEALVNAVAHRDYAMAGAQIRFHLFQDRVEFHVPGALANTLTPDSMELRQYSRNELIVSLLTRCQAPDQGEGARSHMMERRGDGVPIILNESRELSGRKPEYTVIDESELRLVIRAAQAAPE